MNNVAEYKRDKTLELAIGYQDMAYIFANHVRNQPAARASRVIAFFYRYGLTTYAQMSHDYLLRPLVEPYEWSLLMVYGRKYGILN